MPFSQSQLVISTLDLVEGLSTAMDLVSPALNNHQRRVGFVSLQLARALGLPDAVCRDTLMAGMLHDCGALDMPDRTITLTFELGGPDHPVPQGHATAGFRLLSRFAPFAQVARMVRYHHHPWASGAGTAWQGDEVPLAAHILHLADRVDVLVGDTTNPLVLRQEIVDRIGRRTPALFHPEVTAAFQDLAVKEAFWLDMAGISRGATISGASRYAGERLGTSALLEMVRLFGLIIDFRSRFTATHSSGVASSAAALARLAGFSPGQCRRMMVAGHLHDLGKLAVPLEILEKPDRLTPAEVNVIRTHTYYTYWVLAKFRDLEEIRQWAAFHHERLDGRGYPFHHAAAELSPGARMMAVADVFTAITEDRPYRAGMSSREAARILEGMAAGGALDPEIVHLLMDNFDQVNHERSQAQEQSRQEYAAFSAGREPGPG
ncbi:MAG: HD domain-containing phosphohydrolase [Thermodesulfobacteriota bacterium]